MSTHQQLLYHIVFSTKNRKPYLTDGFREKVFAYMAGTSKELEGFALKKPDLEHLIFRRSSTPSSARLYIIEQFFELSHASRQEDSYCDVRFSQFLGDLFGRQTFSVSHLRRRFLLFALSFITTVAFYLRLLRGSMHDPLFDERAERLIRRSEWYLMGSAIIPLLGAALLVSSDGAARIVVLSAIGAGVFGLLASFYTQLCRSNLERDGGSIVNACRNCAGRERGNVAGQPQVRLHTSSKRQRVSPLL